MKKNYTLLVLFLSLFISGTLSHVSGQRTVEVAPGFGTLNDAVFGDTTETGERVDVNTVYVLERDGIYLLNGTMEHRFPLTIVAADGDGARPILQPAVQTGGESSRAFVPRDNLTLRNIYVTNEDEQGGLNKNMIRIKGDKARIILDGCFIEKDTQAPFRLDGDSVSLYLSNSVFANFTGDFDNGRVIDDRGNNIDTLMATNCTFYNIGSRILRDNGGLLTYGEFDQCTFANTGRRVVEFGEVVTAKFTNNLIHNAGIIGQDDESDNAHIMVDSLENQTAIDLGLTQDVVISNVNYYVDPGYTELYPDSVVYPPLLSDAAQAFVDENNTAPSLTNIEFEFTDGPAPNYQNVQDWLNNPSSEETLPDFDTEGEPFDFGYNNPSLAIASTTGGPIGDLSWDIATPPAPELRIVEVAPGFGTLNDAVFGDTTSTGERVNLNTVYVLERDGIYLLNGTMEHRFPLTIIAEPGNGAKPVLQPAVQTGGESSRAFVPRDNLTLRNIYVTNEDEQGGLNKNMIRIKGDKARIVIDSCFLEKDTQAPFRLDGDSVNLYLSNSVFANFAGDFDNGRVIDDRGNNIDTLIATNCTFYNIGSRILRDNGGLMTYGEFEHCTFANTGRRVVEFGEVVTAKFTNNLIHNAGIIGQDDESDNAHIMVDSLENQTAIDLGLTQDVVISNVNYHVDPGYTELYPDSVVFPPVLSGTAQAYVDEDGTGATLTNVEFEFTNGPEPNYQNVQDWINNPSSEETLPDFDTEGEPFDFGYDNATLAAASTTDGPLGDLNWEIIGSVGIFNEQMNSADALISIYPNPVGSFARFNYVVEHEGIVTVEIYNIIGKKVTSLVNELKPAGEYSLDWNVTSASGTPLSTGIYFIKMNVDNQSYTRKMLIK